MKVTIDQDGCTACGGCEQACSDVFSAPQGEKASIVSKYQTGSSGEGDVPDNLGDCARKGEEVCPVNVISVG